MVSDASQHRRREDRDLLRRAQVTTWSHGAEQRTAVTTQARFAVVYRWRVVPAKEEQFQQAWEVLTREFYAQEGSLGSRLHRAADGTWLAYAQWRSREWWEAAEIRTASGNSALEQMADAVEQRFEPILLEPVADYLAGT